MTCTPLIYEVENFFIIIIIITCTFQGSKTIPGGFKVLGLFSIKFKVSCTWRDKEPEFSLSIVACAAEYCLSEIPVIWNAKVDGFSTFNQTLDGKKEIIIY